ncbi:MAG: putative cytosolic protein [Gammaproteobacteria bacterium]|nr:putative cytosolic protein [Gammaproteobacteria bacterium]
MITTLENMLAPALTVLGLELAYVKFTTECGRKTLCIYIDKPGGVTVDDCTRANRQVRAILEAEFPEISEHDLEVSSPGLNRQLITVKHYEQFKGSNIKVSLHHAIEGQKNFKGVLADIVTPGNQITLITDQKTLKIKLEDIEKANLIPELRF